MGGGYAIVINFLYLQLVCFLLLTAFVVMDQGHIAFHIKELAIQEDAPALENIDILGQQAPFQIAVPADVHITAVEDLFSPPGVDHQVVFCHSFPVGMEDVVQLPGVLIRVSNTVPLLKRANILI